MKKEILLIENGIIHHRSQNIFSGLYLPVYEKEITGLICDSTAGKKSLLQFLKGELELSEGRIYIYGDKKSKKEAGRYVKERIAVIEKQSKLICTLGALENIWLFTDKRKFLFKNKYHKDIVKLMNEMEITIRLEDDVNKLSTFDIVILELLKAYVEHKKVVVLADLTSFLRKNELEEIKRITNILKDTGMSFLILESFEDIAFEWTQMLVIIRNGKTVEILNSNMINRQMLYDVLMKKKMSSKIEKIRDDFPEEERVVLELASVSTDHLKDINFSMESGSILKIFCLDDRSGEHIVKLLNGSMRLKNGNITLEGRNFRARSYTQAMKKGICFLEESPYDRSLIYDMTVKDNISLVLSRKSPLIWLKHSFSKSLEYRINDYFEEDIADIKLRKLAPDTLQRLAYFKWILFHPKVVICIKPFAEIDIHIQEITMEMLYTYKKQGISVILLTANFSELGRIEGENIYIKEGRQIDENQVYQILYGDG